MAGPLVASQEVSWAWSVQQREWLQLGIASILVLAFNNAMMSIAWVRARWRFVWLGTYLAALASAVFTAAFPVHLCWPFVGSALCLGFADPRIHIASFLRNQNPTWLKSTHFLGTLVHHASGLLLTGAVYNFFAGRGTMAFFLLPPTLEVVILLEHLNWYLLIGIVLRKLSLLARLVHIGSMLVQAASLVFTVLFVETPGINRKILLGVAVGNTILAACDILGARASTWEGLRFVSSRTKLPGDVSPAQDEHQLVRSASLPRLYFQQSLLPWLLETRLAMPEAHFENEECKD